MNLSPSLRAVLTGAAAVVTFLAASDPFGLPPIVQGVIAVLAVLFGALGLVPPQTGGTQRGVVSPSLSVPPDVQAEPAPGGTTFTPPTTGAGSGSWHGFWPVAALPSVLAADRVNSGEALFWIGVLVVVGCLVAAAVAAFRYANYVAAVILVVIALIAAVLLL